MTIRGRGMTKNIAKIATVKSKTVIPYAKLVLLSTIIIGYAVPVVTVKATIIQSPMSSKRPSILPSTGW